MAIFLQLWGGILYLLSKILIVRAEFTENDRNLRLAGWIAYLLGLPAWVILLAGKQNWIAAASETAGIPSIIFGIVLTCKQGHNPNKYIDWSIRIFTGIMILLGVIFSIYTFNGIRAFSQVLEILIICGFLVSNYLLAKRNPFAWLVFMIVIINTGTLQYIQNKPLLFVQQILSFITVTIGFIQCLKKANYLKRA
jgi:hypothetical protein